MARSKEEIGNSVDPKEPLSSQRRECLFVAEERLFDPRKERVEWWRNAPERVEKYDGGNFLDHEGNILYSYGRGAKLLMGEGQEEIEVMDSCQAPWAHATVDAAFRELGNRDQPIKVLERGFGMGIIASRIIQDLALKDNDSTYTVIELNKKDAEYARRWKSNQLHALTRARNLRGIRSSHKIEINVLEGEAYEETAKLAKALADKPKEKFDIIISDTYPLTEDERGMNDLLDLETLKRCLKPNGVFAFFAHFPGSTDDVSYTQASIIARHFKSDTRSRVTINPPPDYKYLQPKTGPIRSLPVVICKNPIL